MSKQFENESSYTVEQRASMAQAVLTSPAYIWAWEAVRQQLHCDWETVAKTTEQREELYYAMKVLNKTKLYLEQVVQEQQIASMLDYDDFNKEV